LSSIHALYVEESKGFHKMGCSVPTHFLGECLVNNAVY